MHKRKKAEAQKNFIEEKGGSTAPMLHKKYAVRLTDTVKDVIRGDIKNDPVAKQFIPQNEELKILPQELLDPIGDDTHAPVKGIIHRYPDRVLFNIANVCAVYCRYCFRREKVGPGGDILSEEEIEAGLNYIRQNLEISEVILSGGDPLILSPRRLKSLITELEKIDHVKSLRIHSRIPASDPMRITDQMLSALQSELPLYIVVHVNHAQEINDDVKEALKVLHQAECHLLSQSVLLKNVNDNAQALGDLFKALIQNHVKPYYLHHPDKAPGTSHFRLSLKRGREIMRTLRGQISGHALPEYVLDIPGGHGKIPINDTYISEIKDGEYLIEDPKGIQHHYKDD